MQINVKVPNLYTCKSFIYVSVCKIKGPKGPIACNKYIGIQRFIFETIKEMREKGYEARCHGYKVAM